MTTIKYSSPEDIAAYDAAHDAMRLALIDVYRANAARRDGSYDYDEVEDAEFNKLKARYEYLNSVFDSMPEPVRPTRLEEALAAAQAARSREEGAEHAMYAAQSNLSNAQPDTAEANVARVELEAAIAQHKVAAELVWAPMMQLFSVMTNS